MTRVRHARCASAALIFAVLASVPGAAFAQDLSLRTVAEVSAYKDTDAVAVLTPGGAIAVENVTSGWGFGGSFLVDVVTAASVDIVSTSSPRWTDIRYVPGLNGHVKFGDVDVRLAGGASIESDYIAGSGTLGMSVDLADKTITPSVAYTFGYDLAGRRDTPYDVYSLELQRHGLATAITFVVNKSTIFVPTVSAVLEIGDQEKPYRYLPTFTEEGAVEAGASIDEVNAVRTGARIAEEAPDLRNRYALSGLLAHRFGDATVRVEERLYVDTWAMFASTTDFTLPIDIGDSFRIWPHARFHAQKGVSFWSSTYVVTSTSTAGAVSTSVPEFRVGDRELGPMLAGTAGAGFRLGGETVGVTLAIDAIYTRYLDHLFITDKLAGFGALTFDAEVN